MNDSSIVIIGALGQLGSALRERFPGAIAVDRDELDITSPRALETFDWSNVTTIINAAAYTNVDGAETSAGRKQAWLINASASGHLAAIAMRHNLTLVHISSDYVFDGTHSNHLESEPLSPLGVYGQSKAAGDIAVGVYEKHYILRTSWLIGSGKNFIHTMMNLAASGASPAVVDDQIGRLTFAHTLVNAIEHLLSKQLPFGIYNVTNAGKPASWAEIAKIVFSEMQRPESDVAGISTAQYAEDHANSAPRPAQSAYDLSKIKDTGLSLTDWRNDLLTYIHANKE